MKPSNGKPVAAQPRLKLRTNVSLAYWCNPETNYSFEEAFLDLPGAPSGARSNPDNGIAWLDELLDGGIIMPGCHTAAEVEAQTNALTILLAGPPGTGKSTLAMELAYRWCTTDAWQLLLPEGKPRVLYITNESKASWMINNATSLRWDNPPAADIFEDSRDPNKPINPGKVRIQACPSAKQLKKEAELLTGEAVLDAIKALAGMSTRPNPEVVIIDSLNTIIPAEERARIFTSFYNWAAAGPRILLMILDTSSADGASQVWEFASDIVIRLDRKYDESGYTGYMVRSIEIEKARYQKHVWGRHQLKIHEGSSFDENPKGIELAPLAASDRMRAHPYRKQGGVFIFPSIHYVLSLYKRKAPTSREGSIPSCVVNLNRLLGTGYPKGRCTAMIGLRGGHKSHLGYEEILSRILPERQGIRVPDPSQKALIVSLRDDEGFTKDTMKKILERSGVSNAGKQLEDLQKLGLLEITYYPPGYITPEEFFHRLLLSINRLKRCRDAKPPHVSLLFNSLEQLSSRFPLCAKEPIFIPGIIQMLTAEEISSFFVTAVENAPRETYGLETMAELILEFDRRTCSPSEFLSHVRQAYPKHKEEKLREVRKRLRSDRHVVLLRVGRYAGGQAAGAEGILELIEKDNNHPLETLDEKHDLVFMPSAATKLAGAFGLTHGPTPITK